MKLKINPKVIANAALKGGKYFIKGCVYVVPIILAGKYGDKLSWGYSYNPSENTNHRKSSNPSYSNCIKVISQSDLWDSSKKEIISYIKSNETEDYYDAIISVVESDMWDSTKVDTIKSIAMTVDA